MQIIIGSKLSVFTVCHPVWHIWLRGKVGFTFQNYILNVVSSPSATFLLETILIFSYKVLLKIKY